MEYPDYPITWRVSSCDFTILSKNFLSFYLFMIFVPSRAYLGSKSGVSGVVCSLVHVVYKDMVVQDTFAKAVLVCYLLAFAGTTTVLFFLNKIFYI